MPTWTGKPALAGLLNAMLTPGGGASVIVSSYPASDLGEAGVIGSRYCGGGDGGGDGDSDVSGDLLSGPSSTGWEWFPASGVFAAASVGTSRRPLGVSLP